MSLAFQSGSSGTIGTYNYIYDHRSRRVVRDKSLAGGVATQLSYSGGTSVQEWQGNTLSVELIRGSDWGGGIGGILYTIINGQRSFNSYNSRGDVVSTSGENGAATWQASYEAFGTRTAENGDNSSRQRANTKEEDPTGLLNEGMRYRDLESGTFISRDPAGFIDGPNVYTYVRQNPWTSFDPDGLTTATWEAPALGGTVTAVVAGINRFAAQMATGLRAVSGSSVAGTAAATATTSGGVTYSSAAAEDAKRAGISVARTAWQQGRITKEQYVEIAEGVINSQVAVVGMYQGAGKSAGNQVIKQVEEKIANAAEANASANAGATGATARDQQAASPQQASGGSGGGSGGDKKPDNNNEEESKRAGSSKNEKHGDGGRALSKAEKQIKEYEEKLKTANGKEAKVLRQKIKNVREAAQRKMKGEEHSRGSKR